MQALDKGCFEIELFIIDGHNNGNNPCVLLWPLSGFYAGKKKVFNKLRSRGFTFCDWSCS